ncbi:MAG: hypothetical protein L0Z50_22075 [Verrucomicrobiales bacterium]|nr:hypothetical protein [Verrucomicrobiales bacterium]
MSTRFIGSGEISALAQQSDGRVLVGAWSEAGTNVLVRLQPGLGLDESFQVDVRSRAGASAVRGLALLGDGRMYIIGQFDRVNGEPRAGLARLLADGRLDETFAAGSITEGRAVIPGPADGVFVLGNRMDFPNGQRVGLALLTETGALVPEFNPSMVAASVIPAALVLDSQDRPWVAADFNPIGFSSCPVARFVLDSTTNKAVRVLAPRPFGAYFSVGEDAGFTTLIAERLGNLDESLSVSYATRDSTAIGGRDYAMTNGVINWFGTRNGNAQVWGHHLAVLSDFEIRISAPATADPSLDYRLCNYM